MGRSAFGVPGRPRAGAAPRADGRRGCIRLHARPFGVGMPTVHMLEDVGQSFSLTRERIRQSEAKALRKLKHPSRSRKLRSFLDS